MERRRFSLPVEGFELRGELYIPEGKGLHPALCICHGIPRGIRDPGDPGYPALAQRFSAAGFLTLIFNFRGTGESGGNFDIMGWTRDLEAILNHLYHMKAVNRGQICLMGFSGGAVISVYVAAKDQRVSCLIACACPARFRPLYHPRRAKSLLEHFRQIRIIRDEDFPPSIDEWVEGFTRVRPIDFVHSIAPRPLLIIHGTQDDVVEPSQAWELYQKAGQPKQMLMVEGAGHRLRVEEKAMEGAVKWLRRRAFGD